MRVTVIGAGTMGHGIAQVAATAGHDVIVRDVEEELVDGGLDEIERNLSEAVSREKISESAKIETLDRLRGTTDLDAAVGEADLVIEAAPEEMELKKAIFRDVGAAAPASAVLATNTSALSPSEMASSLEDPSRFVGLHFFNPPHLMDLVEIVVAEQTSAETESFARTFVDDTGKEAVVVADCAGFATSRLGIAMGLEAIRMVDQSVASPADIDTAMETGYGYPMGPLELTDHVGLDVRLDIAEHLRSELGERFRPPQLLRRKVRAGKLGKKSGEGFYVWDGDERVGTSGGRGETDE